MQRALVVAVTVLAYSVLYAPQPLLPLLASRFGVTESQAGLLITATLLPLSIAPLSYGYLLRRVAPARLLRVSVAALGALELLFPLAGSFHAMLAIRVAIGFALPAVLTSTMTYTALAARDGAVQREMSMYVAASILGGFLGRAISAVGASIGDWRGAFLLLGAALLALTPLLGRLGTAAPPYPAPHVGGHAEAGGGRLRGIYAAVFCLFFVFAGLLNYIPFRLVELRGGSAGVLAGFIYSGYLLGIVTALASTRIARRLGGETRAIVAGFVLFLVALGCTAFGGELVLFLALFAFCGAMFLVHALATGLVNRGAGSGAGMANGLYLVFYYAGGVLGSYLPGLAYERWGWQALVAVLVSVALAGCIAALSLRLPRAPAAHPA